MTANEQDLRRPLARRKALGGMLQVLGFAKRAPRSQFHEGNDFFISWGSFHRSSN